MQYDNTTLDLDLPLVDLCPDRPLPNGLSRAKGWGWCAASLTPEEQAKSDSLRAIFDDPIKLAAFNQDRIERGIKPVIFNQ